MDTLKALLRNVSDARRQFVEAVSGLTNEQSHFKPTPESWSIVDNVEHMVWAEMGGINGMWKTVEAIKSGNPIWQGAAIHQGLPIEHIIEKTWKPREQVPESARPRWGGPLDYWINALVGCQALLESLCEKFIGYDLEQIVYPHVISGPLNAVQRLEFIRFHLNRHQRQIENNKSHLDFPLT